MGLKERLVKGVKSVKDLRKTACNLVTKKQAGAHTSENIIGGEKYSEDATDTTLQLEFVILDVSYSSIVKKVVERKAGKILGKTARVISKCVPKEIKRSAAIYIIKGFENELIKNINKFLSDEGLSITVKNWHTSNEKSPGVEFKFRLDVDIDYSSLISKMLQNRQASVESEVFDKVVSYLDKKSFVDRCLKYLNVLSQDIKDEIFFAFISVTEQEIISLLDKLAETQGVELIISGVSPVKEVRENRIIRRIKDFSSWLNLWLTPIYPFVVLFFILPVIALTFWESTFGSLVTGISILLFYTLRRYFISATHPLSKAVMIIGFVGVVFVILVPHFSGASNSLSIMMGSICIVLAATLFICRILVFFSDREMFSKKGKQCLPTAVNEEGSNSNKYSV